MPACLYIDENLTGPSPKCSAKFKYTTNKPFKLPELLQLTNGWELFELVVSKIVIGEKNRSLIQFRELNKIIN